MQDLIARARPFTRGALLELHSILTRHQPGPRHFQGVTLENVAVLLGNWLKVAGEALAPGLKARNELLAARNREGVDAYRLADKSGVETQLGKENRRISRNPVFPLSRYRQVVPIESNAAIGVAVVGECDFGTDSLRFSWVFG